MTLACLFVGHKFELTKIIPVGRGDFKMPVEHLVCRRCAKAVALEARPARRNPDDY